MKNTYTAAEIMEKIRKLMKTELDFRGAGNEGAADNYAAKIQELLIKYKLELSDIEIEEENETNPLKYETIKPETWGEQTRGLRVEATEDLAKVIAENFFCRLLVFFDNNALIFVGREKDIEIAVYVFAFVMRSGIVSCEIELAQTLIKNYSDTPGESPASWGEKFNDDFRYSFFCGYNGRIAMRLREQRQRLELEAATNSAALVRIEKEVDDYLTELKPGKEERLPYREAAIRSAFEKGIVYGDEVDLTAKSALESDLKITKLIGDIF